MWGVDPTQLGTKVVLYFMWGSSVRYWSFSSSVFLAQRSCAASQYEELDVSFSFLLDDVPFPAPSDDE